MITYKKSHRFYVSMNIYKYVKSINNTDIPDEYTVYIPKMLTQT